MIIPCKKWFDNETWKIFLGIWHKVLHTPTKEVFQENWLTIRAKYGKHLRSPVDYLKDEIIWPYNQKVIQF